MMEAMGELRLRCHLFWVDVRLRRIAGVWLAIGHITTAIAQAVTIIGIPLAIANLKMIPVTCFPFGKDIVDARSIPYGARPLHSI